MGCKGLNVKVSGTSVRKYLIYQKILFIIIGLLRNAILSCYLGGIYRYIYTHNVLQAMVFKDISKVVNH